MRMANEAYQYAWGCALRDSDERVQVDTEAPSYLNIDVTFAAPENRHRERISLYVPNADFVAKKVGRQWPRLADVVTPGTDANEARQRFVRTLKRYYTSDDVEHRDMQAQAREYSRALREHFGNSKMTEVIFGGVVMNAAGTVAGTAAAGAAAGVAAGPAGALIGAGAGFAVGFVGTVASVYWGVPQSLFRLRARPGSGWIVPTDGHRGGGTSTFQIDPQRAERFLRNVSAFDPGA